MSLYRVGRVWYVDITGPDGGRIRRSTGTADRKAAQEYHDRHKAELWRQARLGEPAPIAWGEAQALWLKEAPRDLSDRYRLNALPIPAKLQINDLTPSLIAHALAGQKPGSYNRYVNLILGILNLSRRKGLITSVPHIERKPEPKGRVRWLTAQEWTSLKRYLPAYLEQMARFTLATGLRENNVLRLEWSQVDMKRKVAWIHPDQAKAREPIGVPLNEEAMGVLKDRSGLDQQWVFAQKNGRPLYKASNRAWYAALKSAGLAGFRWHDLRHTWASWHMMHGTRLEELQQLGGWKTLSMVQRYAHLAPEHLARVAGNVKPVSLQSGRRGKKVRHKCATPL